MPQRAVFATRLPQLVSFLDGLRASGVDDKHQFFKRRRKHPKSHVGNTMHISNMGLSRYPKFKNGRAAARYFARAGAT